MVGAEGDHMKDIPLQIPPTERRPGDTAGILPRTFDTPQVRHFAVSSTQLVPAPLFGWRVDVDCDWIRFVHFGPNVFTVLLDGAEMEFPNQRGIVPVQTNDVVADFVRPSLDVVVRRRVRVLTILRILGLEAWSQLHVFYGRGGVEPATFGLPFTFAFTVTGIAGGGSSSVTVDGIYFTELGDDIADANGNKVRPSMVEVVSAVFEPTWVAAGNVIGATLHWKNDAGVRRQLFRNRYAPGEALQVARVEPPEPVIVPNFANFNILSQEGFGFTLETDATLSALDYTLNCRGVM